MGYCTTVPSSTTVQPAFYYWRTRFQLSDEERQYLQQSGIKRLYLKFFDVDWDESIGQVVPLAQLETDSSAREISQAWTITPTIFVTNRAVQHLEEESVADLANKIERKIWSLSNHLDSATYREIQVDCDWTPSTRERYFQLLGLLRAQLKKKGVLLSATLRLHQLRYPDQTGIPPVARGMLMLYNLGEVEDWQEKNSIFTTSAARSYLEHLPRYPLEYDLALPFFSWGVLFRNGEMIRLINGLQNDSLRGDPRFSEIAPSRFRIKKSTYLNGYYLYQGDLLRLEHCGALELDSAMVLVQQFLAAPPQRSVAIFNFTPQIVHEITAKQLQNVFKKISSP
jgi:hypothetical protein